MNFYVFLAFSFSVIIPGGLGAFRFRKISPVYYPFIFLLWIGVTNELLSYFVTLQGKSNAVNNNLYYLIEGLLVIFQFKEWRLFEAPKTTFSVLAAVFALFWISENFLFRSLQEFNSYFIIFRSFFLVLLSVKMIGKLLATPRLKLTKNSVFIISVSFIVYFTYAAVVEVFYLYGLSSSVLFQLYVVRILAFVNLLTNLLYTIAVLWMPTKQKFLY